jgi:dTDP-4-amino-4,6-dideoxygalactose transaminase
MAIHEEKAYCDRVDIGPRLDLANTEAATRETLMIPIFPDLTEAQQDYVLEKLAACVLARAA